MERSKAECELCRNMAWLMKRIEFNQYKILKYLLSHLIDRDGIALNKRDLILLTLGYSPDIDWEEIGRVLELKWDSIYRHIKHLQDDQLLTKSKVEKSII